MPPLGRPTSWGLWFGHMPQWYVWQAQRCLVHVLLVYIYFFCLPQMLLQSKSCLWDWKICFLSQSRQPVRLFKTSLQTDYHLAVSSAQRPVNTKMIRDAFAMKMTRPALRRSDQKMKRFTGNHCSQGDFRVVCTYPILEKGCMKMRRRRWYWYQTNLFWARIM